MSHKIFDEILTPIIITDLSGKVTYYNLQFVPFSKLTPRKLKGNPSIADILVIKDGNLNTTLEEFKETYSPLITGEVSFIFEQNIDAIYYGVIKLHRHEDNIIFSFLNLSIEKRLNDRYKELVNELKSSHEQLVQADKLATIGEMTANISHEINNPLTIAVGNCELLQTLLEEKDLVVHRDVLMTCTNDILDSFQRITKIITNMKSFLYAGQDDKEYCNLETLIQDSLLLLSAKIEKEQIQIQINCTQHDLVALVSKSKIEQVLVNLIKNAIDSIEEKRPENPKIEITINRSIMTSNLVIVITDNGEGIPLTVAQNMFTPFFTTKESGKGTGLGLSICKQIIDSHHGKIYVNENHKNGASITFELPMIEVSSYIHSEGHVLNLSINDSKKILVVDNEVAVLNLLNKMLSQAGFIFIGSTNGPEAIKFVQNMRPDLVITDYKMPEMTGTEFAKGLRNSGIDTPILYMSSPDMLIHFTQDKIPLTISDFITKPFKKEEVLGQILNTLKK
jgi:signal transduction histidine kinase/CheY-like chemotaxis protein